MKTIALTEAKDTLSELIRKSRTEDVLITIHGRPAAILQGFDDEEAYLEYRLLNDPRFQARVAESRRQIAAGEGTRMEEVDVDW